MGLLDELLKNVDTEKLNESLNEIKDQFKKIDTTELKDAVDKLAGALPEELVQGLKNETKKEEVKVVTSGAGAAAIAIVPLPLVDMIPLIVNETYMICRLAEIYGIPVDGTVIATILGCAGGSIAGKLAACLLPILKIPIAAAITYAVGKVAQAYFESDMKLNKTELREKFLKEEREAKKREWKPIEDEEDSGEKE